MSVTNVRGQVLGYLPKDAMWIVQPALLAFGKKNGPARCRGRLVGGTVDQPTIGVWLDLDLAAVGIRPDQLPEDGALRRED